VTLASILASRSWIIWNEAIGLPNCKARLRVAECRLVSTHLAAGRRPADKVTASSRRMRAVYREMSYRPGAGSFPVCGQSFSVIRPFLDDPEATSCGSIFLDAGNRGVFLFSTMKPLTWLVRDILRPDDRHIAPGRIADPLFSGR